MPFNDPSMRHIAGLSRGIAPIAFQFVNAMRQAGIPAYISSGRRTLAEQARLVASGASRTMQSKHVDGRAFDIDILGYSRDDLPTWWWQQVGEYAEGLGLVWGGRWTTFYDAGHFEV